MHWLSVGRVLLSALSLTVYVAAQQAPFAGSQRDYDHGLFHPIDELSSLSNDSFTTLAHPKHPKHSVRVKKSAFCDGTVAAYTGYIDVGARHLFFYFFESRSDPDRDDVVLWTNGGPGSSSAMGLFMELGPCRISDDKGPKFFNESWNSNANLFFIDQPVGVGFSYADYDDTPVSTTEEAAQDVAAFVSIFFEHFSKFKGRPFHLSGESYAGRYLPLFASTIYDRNPYLVKNGLSPINLTSVMIGNGGSFNDMITSWYTFPCTSAVFPPVLDISTCIRMKQTLPRCKAWVKASCRDVFDEIGCGAAWDFCLNELFEPYLATKRNAYDITEKCEDPWDCYPARKHVTKYLNDPAVQKTLGVSSASGNPVNWTMSNMVINSAFTLKLDPFTDTTRIHMAMLLERGVKFLIYVGTNDWISNVLGTREWVRNIGWTGQEEFNREEEKEREWFVEREVRDVDGGGSVLVKKSAGVTRSARGLTFVTIEGAGHLAPFNKPKESLEMVNRWLKGIDM